MSKLPKKPEVGDDASELIGDLKDALNAGETLKSFRYDLDGRYAEGETFDGGALRVLFRGGLNGAPWVVDCVEAWPT